MDTTGPNSVEEHLQNLARHLLGAQEAIFSAWRRRVEADPALVTNAQLTRAQFVDHMPLVLADLTERLKNKSQNESQGASGSTTSHSQHRWQQGYDLRNLVGEWVHFNTVLVEEIERYGESRALLPAETLAAARRVLAEFFGENVTQGAVAYHELLQSEAATRVRELEVALEKVRDFERRRGQLLRTSVHDLQGSLGIVTGNVEIMDYDQLTDEDRVEIRQLLQHGVSNLKDMLAELMDMGRLEAGQEQRVITAFDAGEVLAELCATSQTLAQTSDLYLRSSGPTTLRVSGDALKVRRIAQNLILNALKYTTRGGVSVVWGENGERWFLEVKDTGPGLQASTAAPLATKLAKATETAHEIEGNSNHNTLTSETISPPKQSSGGEGVGLVIVKRLCELLDATLELESEVDVGTTFRVSFPRHYPENRDDSTEHAS